MTTNYNIFNPAFDEILLHVSWASSILDIDFYLAGAVARDYHLSKDKDYRPSRRTADIDIAVMVSNEDEFCALKNKLIETGDFEQHTEPIKLIYKNSIELDLLPFGDIEKLGITYLTKPKSFILDVPGFSILNKSAQQISWNGKIKTKVCTLQGIVLLKLVAYDDRPQRTKDLLDIQLIIKLYFDTLSEDVYEHHFDLMSKYEPNNNKNYIQQVCAHVIGRKIKLILKDDTNLLERVIKILQWDRDHFWENLLAGLIE